ncbi:hypothetical protein O181_050356 [Austropuccinia psidii MF-1]|uniref:Protein kinase domain-containing protein n=1 Tax=Austropuccinia psidii MF-1 TaxID=1389203 RepID=A0A9Q3HMA4_9BASI|nr:hypothetical protein [Austropuccinia psidii MF-1]
MEEYISRSSRSAPSLKDYQLCQPVGEGTFGKVWLARCRQNGASCAVKVVRRDIRKHESGDGGRVRREVDCLKRIDPFFPFICQFYEDFENDEYHFMVLQFHPGGTLRQLIHSMGALEEAPARIYVAELTLALDHLKRRSIVFRDLKTDNVLIDAAGHLKLTDFGLAKIIRQRTNSCTGSPHIMAPETLPPCESYDFKADWYSLGVCMYEMLCGAPPFSSVLDQIHVLFMRVTRDEIEFPETFSPESCQVLQKLFRKNPHERLASLEEMQRQKWFERLNWNKVLSQQYPGPYIARETAKLSLHSYPAGFTHFAALEYM